MKNDRVYLLYILECIRRIEEDTVVGKDPFLSSHTHQDAVLRNLQTMAETTQRLSATLKQQYVHTEWDRIAALRNVLVHDYLGVDLEQVWRIAQENVPELKLQVLAMLRDLGKQT